MTPITSIRMLVVSRIFAGVALAIGVLGLMGYALALPALITVHSGYRGMAPLTATSIILVALSVVGLGRENPVTARLAAGLAICVAGIALVSHLVAGADVVSPWVANMIFATPAQIVGRMSYGSVLGVSLVAFSVIMRHSQSRAADLAGGAALIVSGVAVLGYAYGVSDLYALPISTRWRSTRRLRSRACRSPRCVQNPTRVGPALSRLRALAAAPRGGS